MSELFVNNESPDCEIKPNIQCVTDTFYKQPSNIMPVTAMRSQPERSETILVRETVRSVRIGKDGTIKPFEHSEEDQRFYSGWTPTSQPSEIDLVESERVARQIRATERQCWFNARKAICKLNDYEQAAYIEGFALLVPCFVIEHGRIVRDGRIIDPTLPQSVLAYYPGLEFRGRAGIEDFLATPLGRKHKNSPFFFAFGWCGHFSPSFATAREIAEANYYKG
jgi:hypothetical protein